MGVIKAIFFTRFLEKEGTRVIYQVPPSSIVLEPDRDESASEDDREEEDDKGGKRVRLEGAKPDRPSSSGHPGPRTRKSRSGESVCPMVDFDSIAPYLIPRHPFCDTSLSVRVSTSLQLVGHPVWIEDSARYGRGTFIFNLAVVVDARDGSREERVLSDDKVGSDKKKKNRGSANSMAGMTISNPTPMDDGVGQDVLADMVAVVSKLGRLLRGLEELTGFLSAEDGLGGKSGRIPALAETIMQDLNQYAECMIPIDSANSVNLKLFPARPRPSPIGPTAVPVLTTNLPFDAISTDITIRRLLPHIQAGLLPVDQLAVVTGIEPRRVRLAVEHLLFYDCVVLLDRPFSFSGVYGATPTLAKAVIDPAVVGECIGYVGTGGAKPTLTSSVLIRLFCALTRPRRSVREFVIAEKQTLDRYRIDVRRLVVFGLLKGIIYAVRKWVVMVEEPVKTAAAVIALARGRGLDEDDVPAPSGRDGDSDGAPVSGSVGSHVVYPASTSVVGPSGLSAMLARYTNLTGTHPVDALCARWAMPEKDVVWWLSRPGKIAAFVYR